MQTYKNDIKNDLFYVYIWVSAMHLHVPAESRRGHQIPWIWSYRRILSDVVVRNRTQVLWKNNKWVLFNQRTISPAPRETFYFAFKVLDIFRIHLWKIFWFTKLKFLSAFGFQFSPLLKPPGQDKNSFSCKALDIQNHEQNLQVFLGLLERKLQLGSIYWDICESSSWKRCCWGALAFGDKWAANHECPWELFLSQWFMFFFLFWFFCSCFKRWGFKSLDRFSAPSLNQLFFFIIWKRLTYWSSSTPIFCFFLHLMSDLTLWQCQLLWTLWKDKSPPFISTNVL